MLILNIRDWFVSGTMALVLFIPGLSVAENDTSEHHRPSIGLVLSGGGALGYAHIGVLKVLEQMHVPIDCVVGTSMGALVGGVYASGVRPEQIEHRIEQTDIEALFDDQPPRPEITERIKQDSNRPLFDLTLGVNDGINLPTGASAGYKFELFLKELIGLNASVVDMDFDKLPTPYRAIATDLETGDMEVFSKGELPKVMRASMSLPAIVAPEVIDDRAYIDGGLVRNLPVDTGRNLCADVVIAVNLGTSPKPREEIKNSLDVALQSILILTEQNVKTSLQELGEDDILIAPELDGFSSSSFSSSKEIIERGVAAAKSMEHELSRLSVSPDEYKSWQANRIAKRPKPLTVSKITAQVTGNVSTGAVVTDIPKDTGKSFDLEKLNRNITSIYGRGDFSYVGYSVIPYDDAATIDIEAESKPWGPGYLKFGLGAVTDLTSPTQLNFAASYRRTWINSLGAEWRTDMQLGYDSFVHTEFFQPLQYRDGLFIAPYLLARRNFIQLYLHDVRLGDVRVERYQGGLDIGLTGSLGELRLGPFINRVNQDPGLGAIDSLFERNRSSQNGVELSGVIDQMDSLAFPRSGLHLALDIRAVEQSGDEPDNYTRAQASLGGALSLGESTVRANLEWGDEISGKNALPVFEQFQLGGPLRLSGLYLDQLTGYRYQLAAVSYYYRYSSLPSQLGRGIYVGMSLEAGRVDDPFLDDPFGSIASASIFWGADTILGAMYIGYGESSLDNQQALYISIGPQF
jgi:NTE family protein